MSEFSSTPKRIFELASKKLGKVGFLNLAFLGLFLIYAIVKSAKDWFVSVIYAVGDIIGQISSNKPVRYTSDYIPEIIYLVFIFVAFIACMLLVHWHERGKLWS